MTCKLQLRVNFVVSAENYLGRRRRRTDALTRVPKKWLTPPSAPMICGAAAAEPDVARVHQTSGHPGITRTLRLCRRQSSDVTRAPGAQRDTPASGVSDNRPRTTTLGTWLTGGGRMLEKSEHGRAPRRQPALPNFGGLRPVSICNLETVEMTVL